MIWRIKSFPAGKFVSNNLFTFSNSEFLPEKVKILLRYNQISGNPIATLSLSDQKSTGPRTGGADYGRKVDSSNTEAVAGDIKVELKKIGDSKYYEGLADINWGDTRFETTVVGQNSNSDTTLDQFTKTSLYIPAKNFDYFLKEIKIPDTRLFIHSAEFYLEGSSSPIKDFEGISSGDTLLFDKPIFVKAGTRIRVDMVGGNELNGVVSSAGEKFMDSRNGNH